MKFDQEVFKETIGDTWERNLSDAIDSIDRRSHERCPVSAEILELVHIATAEAYCAALKTIEDALAVSFISNASDTSPTES